MNEVNIKMKKICVMLLVVILCVSVQARSEEPRFEIISNSHNEVDIKEMYNVKSHLLEDYKEWIKGVDSKEQALADHQSDYNAIYKQGVYRIVLGQGQGKSLKGELKVNYCESTQDIKKKSFLFDWLFSW